MKRFKNSIEKKMEKVVRYGRSKVEKAKVILVDQRGEGYIDTAVVILISVVLGALLLAGLYALFGDVVLPELQRRITEMFNYAG